MVGHRHTRPRHCSLLAFHSLLSPPQTVVASGSAMAVARWLLAETIQHGGAVSVSPLLCSLLRLNGSFAQQLLPAHMPVPVRLAAICASSYLSCELLGMCGLAYYVRLAGGKWEEVPLTGRRRPAMEPLSERERAARASLKAQYTDAMANYVPGVRDALPAVLAGC